MNRDRIELTGETRTHQGRTLHRIRTLVDVELVDSEAFYNPISTLAKAGELGGWVENPDNLRDNAWVGGDAMLLDGATMEDYATLVGNAVACGNARMLHAAHGAGNARIGGNATMEDNANALGNAHVDGNARMADTSTADGDSHITGTALLEGEAWISGTTTLSAGTHGDDHALTA